VILSLEEEAELCLRVGDAQTVCRALERAPVPRNVLEAARRVERWLTIAEHAHGRER
jgi:hypothetical protein